MAVIVIVSAFAISSSGPCKGELLQISVNLGTSKALACKLGQASCKATLSQSVVQNWDTEVHINVRLCIPLGHYCWPKMYLGPALANQLRQ